MVRLLLYVIILFFIIYFAVRIAITPLIGEELKHEESSDLIHLRDMGVLTNEEMEDIISVNKIKLEEERLIESHLRYIKILTEAKDRGCIDDENLNNKLEILKQQYEKCTSKKGNK